MKFILECEFKNDPEKLLRLLKNNLVPVLETYKRSNPGTDRLASLMGERAPIIDAETSEEIGFIGIKDK